MEEMRLPSNRSVAASKVAPDRNSSAASSGKQAAAYGKAHFPHYSAQLYHLWCMDPEVSERYSRQERFAGIGREGQQRIQNSRVAVVGCGALGSVHAELMARAGVGFIRIIDRDYVELSNLQRQLLFDEADARRPSPKRLPPNAEFKRSTRPYR